MASPTAGTFGGFPTGTVGWASITSNQPIFAAVTELNGSISKGTYSCMSFRGEVFAPVAKFGFPNATDASARNTEVVLLNNGEPASSLQVTTAAACREAARSSRTLQVAPLNLQTLAVDLSIQV